MLMLQFPAPIQQARLRRNGVQRCPCHADRWDAQPVDSFQCIKLRNGRKVIYPDKATGVKPTPVGGAVHHAQLQQIPVVLA